MTGIMPESADPVAGLKQLLVWDWFQEHESRLVDFAKESYRLAAQMTLRQGDTLSNVVRVRVETYLRTQASLRLTLKRRWPNHRPSKIAEAHLVAAALVSLLLVGHDYWYRLQAP